MTQDTRTAAYETLDAQWRDAVRARDELAAAAKAEQSPRLVGHYAARRAAMTRRIKALEARIDALDCVCPPATPGAVDWGCTCRTPSRTLAARAAEFNRIHH